MKKKLLERTTRGWLAKGYTWHHQIIVVRGVGVVGEISNPADRVWIVRNKKLEAIMRTTNGRDAREFARNISWLKK